MKAKLLDINFAEIGQYELKGDIFGLEPREDILQRVVRWQLAKKQSGTHKTKGLDEVSGTGKKPHKQKGTGRARLGTLRAPQCRGGAIVFGPQVRSHEHKLPKKVRKLGLKHAFSAKFATNEIIILNDMTLANAKTSELVKKIKSLNSSSILFIDSNLDNNFKLASSNIKNVKLLPQIGANVFDLLKHQTVIISAQAVKDLEGRLA